MSLTLITAPAAEPITAADAITRAHLRLDDATDDSLVGLYIAAARRQAEQITGRCLIEQTWELWLDAFPAAEIDLRLAPVSAIVSVTYTDTAGADQVLDPDAYLLDAVTSAAWLLPAVDTDWPETQDIANAVRIRFTAGYGATGDDVPEDIRLWLLATVAHWYRSREIAGAAMQPLPCLSGLLDPYRLLRA